MSLPSYFRSIFAVLAIALGACGSEIGDSCLLNSDCDPTGQRICDQTQNDGFCTILGCDFDTCPEEAVCVRFFVGGFTDVVCDPATEDLPNSDGTDDCSFEELCTLAGRCVPRSAESRYCMRKCGDCRDGYECRDRELMIEHGGEPVLPPDERHGDDPQPFCAEAPF
jgi:hypothetical protein